MTVFDIKIGTPPYYFGFIGGDFNQNIFSVEYFINNFYKNFPEKPFIIAGKVCENKYIKKLTNIYPNITLRGYVKSCQNFTLVLDFQSQLYLLGLE